MKKPPTPGWFQLSAGATFFLFLFLAWPSTLRAQTQNASQAVASPAPPQNPAQQYQATNNTVRTSTDFKIPPGTILPIILRTSLSFKCKTGDLIRGKIAQDVPLPSGFTIRRGSEVTGHIVEVTPAGIASGPAVSLRFDAVHFQGARVPIVTNLRAIAGFMEVGAAAYPEEDPKSAIPYRMLNTAQIGGQVVFGFGGPVTSAENTSIVVGKSVGDGGILAPAIAKPGSSCRGAVADNDRPQAMWVFSSDACGIYGIDHLKITHAGRTDPKGVIVLASDKQNLKLRNGDGLLLRVNE